MKKPRVLIVDDEASVRETLEAQLHKENYRLEFARSEPAGPVSVVRTTNA